MSPLKDVLTITALAGMGGTGLGGALAALGPRHAEERFVSLLLSFAAGVMTALVCLDLLPEALDAGGLVLACLALSGGCAVTAGLEGLLSRRGSARQGLLLSGLITAAAIAVHNLPEGMVIGAAWALDRRTASAAGLTMAVVIGLHNIPEGMAVAAPLIGGGCSRRRAVLTTALAGAPTVLGAAMGYSLGTMGPRALALSLGFAGGAMLYVAFAQLLPESAALWRSRLPAWAALGGILTGLVILRT